MILFPSLVACWLTSKSSRSFSDGIVGCFVEVWVHHCYVSAVCVCRYMFNIYLIASSSMLGKQRPVPTGNTKILQSISLWCCGYTHAVNLIWDAQTHIITVNRLACELFATSGKRASKQWKEYEKSARHQMAMVDIKGQKENRMSNSHNHTSHSATPHVYISRRRQRWRRQKYGSLSLSL